MKKASASAVSKPVPKARTAPDAPTLCGWLFPGYLALIFLGYILLRTPGAMTAGQEMGAVRALFSAVNAATLTGFKQTTDIDKYRPLGQAAIFILIVCGSVFSLIIGGTAAARILRLGISDNRVAKAAIVAEIAAVGLGSFFLLFDKDRTLGQAVFMAASAFGNGGLCLGPTPNPTAWQTHLFILPLIFLGGIGLCTLIELYDSVRHKRPVSTHGRAALGSAAWFYVGGTAILAALELNRGQSLNELIPASAAAAIGSRTAGMGLAAVEHLSRPAIWVLMILMAVGGASAGTAGGIKTTTITEVFRGVRRALSGQSIGRPFGIAASWLGGYCMLVLAALILLLQRMPDTPADQVLFTTVSAASNVGLAFAPINPEPVTAYVLSATMLIGRFAPMMVLWWMADTTHDADIAV
jgi:trk system potassium uptake protein